MKGTYNTNSGYSITIDNEPGEYTITCIIKVTYTDAGIDAVSGQRNTYTIYGHEKQAAVVILKPGESVPTITTPAENQQN